MRSLCVHARYPNISGQKFDEIESEISRLENALKPADDEQTSSNIMAESNVSSVNETADMPLVVETVSGTVSPTDTNNERRVSDATIANDVIPNDIMA